MTAKTHKTITLEQLCHFCDFKSVCDDTEQGCDDWILLDDTQSDMFSDRIQTKKTQLDTFSGLDLI